MGVIDEIVAAASGIRCRELGKRLVSAILPLEGQVIRQCFPEAVA